METVLRAYLDELKRALYIVEELLANVDAKANMITADDGICWGDGGFFSHGTAVQHPHLRKVRERRRQPLTQRITNRHFGLPLTVMIALLRSICRSWVTSDALHE